MRGCNPSCLKASKALSQIAGGSLIDTMGMNIYPLKIFVNLALLSTNPATETSHKKKVHGMFGLRKI